MQESDKCAKIGTFNFYTLFARHPAESAKAGQRARMVWRKPGFGLLLRQNSLAENFLLNFPFVGLIFDILFAQTRNRACPKSLRQVDFPRRGRAYTLGMSSISADVGCVGGRSPPYIGRGFRSRLGRCLNRAPTTVETLK